MQSGPEKAPKARNDVSLNPGALSETSEIYLERHKIKINQPEFFGSALLVYCYCLVVTRMLIQQQDHNCWSRKYTFRIAEMESQRLAFNSLILLNTEKK